MDDDRHKIRLRLGTLPMTEDVKTLPGAILYFKPPFKYEPMGQTIVCENNSMALQVRGWGNLMGANGLDHDTAAKMQDQFGVWVAEQLNKAVEEFFKIQGKKGIDNGES